MHDLIEQIEDKRERERFRQVWEESIREKKFGLVFEPHLPELLLSLATEHSPDRATEISPV